jgi:hypothetical protein
MDMADNRDDKPTLTPAGRRSAEDRQLRLAAALRQNLRKRKAQQRSRRDGEGPPAAPDPRRGDRD